MSDERISVVIPVARRADPLREIVALVRAGLARHSERATMILVVDGDSPARLGEARALAETDPSCRVLALARSFGEGAALRAGVDEADTPIVLTHPAYFQVEPEVLSRLVEEVEQGADLAFASRTARKESWINRLQRWGFNALVRRAVWVRFKDISSSVSALRRESLQELAVHEFAHRFLPVLASMRGLEVREIPAPVHPGARHRRVYSPGTYLRRLLDVLNVFFLLRFLFKPLRFFGLIGSAMFTLGTLLCLYFAALKLLAAEPLGNRPAFLLGVLLVAVGFQTLAIGLLGELITFTHASKNKPYRVKEVVERKPPR